MLEDISRNFFYVFFVSVIKQVIINKYIYSVSVFIVLKGLLSANTPSIKLIVSLCFSVQFQHFLIFQEKIIKFFIFPFSFNFYRSCILNLCFNVGLFYFLCLMSLNKSSFSSSSNFSRTSGKLREFLISKLFFLSYSSFLVIFEAVAFFILKFISSTRLEIDSNSRSYAPLKVSYERFLYNSVIACSSIER